MEVKYLALLSTCYFWFRGGDVVVPLFVFNRQNLLRVTCTRESALWTQRY